MLLLGYSSTALLTLLINTVHCKMKFLIMAFGYWADTIGDIMIVTTVILVESTMVVTNRRVSVVMEIEVAVVAQVLVVRELGVAIKLEEEVEAEAGAGALIGLTKVHLCEAFTKWWWKGPGLPLQSSWINLLLLSLIKAFLNGENHLQ